MNCKETEIWLNEASKDMLQKPEPEVERHVATCTACNGKRTFLLEAIRVIEFQAESSYPEDKSSVLIEKLIKSSGKRLHLMNQEWFMRIAAVAVIVFGVLLGMLVGTRYTITDNESAFWTEEFAVLSDDSDVLLFD